MSNFFTDQYQQSTNLGVVFGFITFWHAIATDQLLPPPLSVSTIVASYCSTTNNGVPSFDSFITVKFSITKHSLVRPKPEETSKTLAVRTCVVDNAQSLPTGLNLILNFELSRGSAEGANFLCRCSSGAEKLASRIIMRPGRDELIQLCSSRAKTAHHRRQIWVQQIAERLFYKRMHFTLFAVYLCDKPQTQQGVAYMHAIMWPD